MQRNGQTIAIYSRKSRFTGKGESIGNQVELCREYLRLHNGEAALENIAVFEDEGFSGGNLDRPGFQKMMEAAQRRELSAIIVYRLDRISRNISDFAGLIEELGRLGVAFISIKEQFDTSSPMGRAMMYITSVFSQLERETIAERIRDNMRELAKTGRWLGGNTPTGYSSEAVKNVTIDGKTKRACKLKLLPEEAETVRLIFELYQQYDSQTLTEAELIKRGIRTKNGKWFTRFSIKAILQNPVYLIADQEAYQYFIRTEAELFSGPEDFDGVHGIMAYNRTLQKKGKATEFLPPSEWIVSVGQHPGLIPGNTWVAIQESLERNKSKAYRKPRSNEALLTGLVFCSCGNRMYPKLDKRRTADGQPNYTYVCKLKERSKRSACSRKNINGRLLDAAVIEQIKLLEEDKESFLSQLEKSKRFYTGSRTAYENRLAELREEKAALERKMDALVDSLAELAPGTARNHVAKRIEQLHQEGADLDAKITELEGLTTQQELSDIAFDSLRQLLAVFASSIDEMSVEQKRAAIRTLVRKVIWDGKNAHIVLFGVEDDEVELPGPSDSAAFENADPEEEDPSAVEPKDTEGADRSAAKPRWREDSK